MGKRKKCDNCGRDSWTIWEQLTGEDRGRVVIMCDYCFKTEDFREDESIP